VAADEGDIRKHLGRYAEGWPPAAGKPPTVADGVAFAAAATGQIEAILSDRGVVTPVTVPPQFVQWLDDLAAMYAASLVAAALFPQAAGPGSTTHHEFLMRQYRQGLEDLRKGDVLPGGLILLGTELARSFWTTHPYDDNGNETTVPAFTRDMKW
jgi:hypothetical protein